MRSEISSDPVRQSPLREISIFQLVTLSVTEILMRLLAPILARDAITFKIVFMYASPDFHQRLNPLIFSINVTVFMSESFILFSLQCRENNS